VWLGSALITLYITWSPWHFAGQNYGLALMFLRRRGVDVTPGLKRLLYTSFICSFLLVFLLAHGPIRALGIFPVPSFDREVYGFLSLGLPELPTRVALVAVAIACAGSLASSVVLLLRRASLSTLAPTLCLVALQAMWFSVPAALAATGGLTFTALALSSVWIAFAHSLQYLWVTSYYAQRSEDAPRLPGYLLRTLAWGSAVTVLPALAFAPSLLGGVSYHAGLAILLFAVVNLHHFLLDGAIWKLRDGRVASVLLRDDAGTRAEPTVSEGVSRLGLSTVYAVGVLCAAIGFYGAWENQFGVVSALERGDLARAERANDRLAWIGRESHAVHQQLGRRLGERRQWERARWHLERSLEIQPSVEAWYVIADVYAETGNPAAAREALDAALALRPEHLPSLKLLARVSSDQGDPAGAREALERAAALVPGDHSIRAALVKARHAERDASRR
jgi:tetratricopeptide (TPR) repeat protein